MARPKKNTETVVYEITENKESREVIQNKKVKFNCTYAGLYGLYREGAEYVLDSAELEALKGLYE